MVPYSGVTQGQRLSTDTQEYHKDRGWAHAQEYPLSQRLSTKPGVSQGQRLGHPKVSIPRGDVGIGIQECPERRGWAEILYYPEGRLGTDTREYPEGRGRAHTQTQEYLKVS